MEEKKTVGNYQSRECLAQKIVTKIKNNKPLTDEEKDLITSSILDPLGEFCLREGTFRLVEILNIDPDTANKLEDKASEAIRDTIDYDDDLYDRMDDELRTVLDEAGC